eukprot:6492597-Amphidinium_carterae.6
MTPANGSNKAIQAQCYAVKPKLLETRRLHVLHPIHVSVRILANIVSESRWRVCKGKEVCPKNPSVVSTNPITSQRHLLPE